MQGTESDPTKRNTTAEDELYALRERKKMLDIKKSEYEKALWELDTEISSLEAQIANVLCCREKNLNRNARRKINEFRFKIPKQK